MCWFINWKALLSSSLLIYFLSSTSRNRLSQQNFPAAYSTFFGVSPLLSPSRGAAVSFPPTTISN